MALVASICFVAPGVAQAARFSDASVDAIPSNHLFDLGVADYNGDGRIDLFTTNHKYRGGLLRNNGSGFSDVVAGVGLSPSPPFPGLEYLRAPDMSDVAVYIWVTDDARKSPAILHLRSNGADADGKLTFESDKVDLLRTSNATVERGRSPSGRPTLDFRLREEGVVEVSVDNIDLPTAVSINGTLPGLPLPIEPPILQPDDIRVGTLGVEAKSRKFSLSLRDRHGLVFADLGAGGAADAFFSNGGLGGKIALPGVKGRVQDELFFADDGRFRLATPGSGLDKGRCRGRQVAAVDIDANGALDLFEACEGVPPNVYLQKDRGEFKRVAPPRTRGSNYRWVNLRGKKPALLASEPNGIRVVRRSRNGWRNVQRIAGNSRSSDVAGFALNDIDTDGDVDVFAYSGRGSTMLKNVRGRLHKVPLGRFGLPKRSLAASFVDYDNDGLEDLHLIPQGLYRGRPGKRYRRTDELKFGRRTGAAVTNWFDEDNDGLREPVVAYSAGEFSRRSTIRRKHNLGPGGHWLEVDLIGDRRNAQAIGGRVSVKTGNRTQYQWVGQNDDSRFSQGHYRLYFGLGGRDRVERLQVKWPDGARTNLSGVDADRVLRLTHP